MKRVLFISNLFPDRDSPWRGLDNAVLLRELAHDLDVRVISPRPTLLHGRSVRALKALEIDAAALQPSYVPTAYLPKIGSRWNAALMRCTLRRDFRKAISEYQPDVVLTSWLFPDGCAVAGLAQEHELPHVMITQGSDTHVYLEDPIRRQQILAAIGSSAAVICRSADLGKRLADAGAERARLHTVYNGVDTSIFYPRNRADARSQILPELATNSRMLVFVGNFLPVKNPLFLLRAHAACCERSKEPVKLCLIGAGPLEAAMRSEVGRLGTTADVIFTGPLPSANVAEYIAAADALCLTSHNEGLPNVILEALACATPVVATDVGGIAELIDRDERGLLVSPDDSQAYVEALAKALAHANNGSHRHVPPVTLSWVATAQAYRAILLKAPCLLNRSPAA